MARIAFNSTAGNTGGSGWTPLPAGDTVFQIDNVEQTVSSNNNAQLKFSMHVAEGPHTGAKATTWYSLLPQAAFRLESLLNAALDESAYDRVDTGEVQVRGDKEEPIYAFDFDTDDLIGAQVIFDVTVGEYNGKPKNEFNSPRPVGAAPAPAARPAAPAARAVAPATRAAAPAARAVVAQPARRTVGR
jgi:hypothetical protein